MDREEISSPIVTTESIIIMATIDTKENRDVGTCDIPNTFIQTDLKNTRENKACTIMKIHGILVQMLCKIDSIYRNYVEYENDKPVLYIYVTKVI